MNPWASTPSTKRRDKLFIIAEILEIARDGTLKTQIMYRANLSFTQLNDYLDFMLKTNLLDKTAHNSKDVYGATEKGTAFLARYREISELLKDEEKTCRNNVKIPPAHLLKRT
jgi:predicted transcriptional regulator